MKELLNLIEKNARYETKDLAALLSEEEVDELLKLMMKNIYRDSKRAAQEYGLGYDLIGGANIAGFEKVARAMYEQGIF